MAKANHQLLVEFGLRVRQTRQKQQLSQDDLGNSAGLHRTYITDIEAGRRNVSLLTIAQIAKALSVPMTTLILDGEKPAAPVDERKKRRARS